MPKNTLKLPTECHIMLTKVGSKSKELVAIMPGQRNLLATTQMVSVIMEQYLIIMGSALKIWSRPSVTSVVSAAKRQGSESFFLTFLEVPNPSNITTEDWEALRGLHMKFMILCGITLSRLFIFKLIVILSSNPFDLLIDWQPNANGMILIIFVVDSQTLHK